MDIIDVADAIGEAVSTIPGLRVFPFMPDNIQPPSVVVTLPQITYDVTFGDCDRWFIPVWLFVSKVSDKAARKEVAGYLARGGASSIKAAIEVDETLDATCDSVAVKTARPQIANFGGTEYLAIEFTVEVYGT